MMSNYSEQKIRTYCKNILQFLTIGFSIILLLDMNFLGHDHEKVVATYAHTDDSRMRHGSHTEYGFLTNNRYYEVSRYVYENLEKGDEVVLHKSIILREIKTIENNGGLYHTRTASIYGAYNLFPISCIILSCIALILRIKKSKYLFYVLSTAGILFFFMIQSIVFNLT